MQKAPSPKLNCKQLESDCMDILACLLVYIIPLYLTLMCVCVCVDAGESDE